MSISLNSIPVITVPGIGRIDVKEIKSKYDAWFEAQPVPFQIFFAGFQSAAQGAAMGYFLGSVNPAGTSAPGVKGAPAKPLSPIAQATNMAVLMGVNSSASVAIKKARNGKDDVYTSMGASFLSGVAYSLVSGAPDPVNAALSSGVGFAAFNGLFYQFGNMFGKGNSQPDTDYVKAKILLSSLGLAKYVSNIKKGLLDDKTIMLWNESALKEARIPAGPRLLILHHLDQYRSPSSILKPALPVPMLHTSFAAPATSQALVAHP
nr:mitochondrial inner membrane translocase 17 (tim17) [Polytomella parva]|eukprot:CAMPEP_0175074266 /NCGR_PEP_ID=MMETSP0052_2-20121109/21182_1 /TAXON_ID=51329 ORGANISM="Polytomella parva, Strain SAG 63-3" /NCGR_SAMPLE_ID=MMETSP0052_2 /ASSEMBLY_ACC=CAM_ASM_000194 /LENGTH=262 /DNA_ID=CAMNT_0016342487 /DNA_START=27 /DNA_END=815 /DNA_ORIENTATION=-